MTVQLNKSYLEMLYNTPSSVLPTNDLPARILADTGHNFSIATVRAIFKSKANLPLKNRVRKEKVVSEKGKAGRTKILDNIEIVDDTLPVETEEVVNALQQQEFTEYEAPDETWVNENEEEDLEEVTEGFASNGTFHTKV